MWEVASFAAALMTAGVVPFLSVYVAQALAGRDADLRETRELLAKVNIDYQRFINAVLALRNTDHFGDVQNSAGQPLPTDFWATRHEQVQAVVDCVMHIENDCNLLGLNFGDQGEALGKSLRALSLFAKAYLEPETSPPRPPPNECFRILELRKAEIVTNIKALWASERSRRWWRPRR